MLANARSLVSSLRTRNTLQRSILKSHVTSRVKNSRIYRTAAYKPIPRLIITDKPDSAATIARLLNLTSFDKNLDKSYFGDTSSGQDVVAWCFQNSFHIPDPTPIPKYWRLAELPYFPEIDGIKPANDQSKESIDNLVSLLDEANMVICAMQANSDGQLLFQDLLTYALNEHGITVPENRIWRLWPHDMTKETLDRGLANPFPHCLFKNLAKAAQVRRFIEWSGRHNFSKLYTMFHSTSKQQIFNLSPVEMQLTRVVTERYLERKEFVPNVYHEVHLDCLINDSQVTFKWTKDHSNLGMNSDSHEAPVIEQTTIDNDVKKYLNKGNPTFNNSISSANAAQTIAKKIEPTCMVVSRRAQNILQPPPLLYNLTSLQREAYERYSISPTATQAALLALHEKHCLISNPTTDSHQLPDDLHRNVAALISALKNSIKYAPYFESATDEYGNPWNFAQRIRNLDPRIFSSSLEAHQSHAIIPIIPKHKLDKNAPIFVMTSTMALLYDMIVRRFLSVFMPDSIHSTITVTLENNDKYYFDASASIVKHEGWRAVSTLPKAQTPFKPAPTSFASGYLPTKVGQDMIEKDLMEQKKLYHLLSGLKFGEEINCKAPASVITKETSPPFLFTTSSILSLLEGECYLEDGKLVTTVGIGKAHARADILKHLSVRQWLRTRHDGYIEPSRKAIILTKFIQDDVITDIKQNTPWEESLIDIENGNALVKPLIKKFKAFIEPEIKRITSTDLDLPRVDLAYDLIYYHISGHNRAMNAAPVFRHLKCPKCGSASLMLGPTAYFCSAAKCNFTMRQVVGSILLTAAEAEILISKKQTEPIENLRDLQGNRFTAKLELKPPDWRIIFVDKTITRHAPPERAGKMRIPPFNRHAVWLNSKFRKAPILVRVRKYDKAGRPPRISVEEKMAERVHSLRRLLLARIKRELRMIEEKLDTINKQPAPPVRVTPDGRVVIRMGRPRIGEYVPPKPEKIRRKPPGRPKSVVQLPKRKGKGRPTDQERLERKAQLEQLKIQHEQLKIQHEIEQRERKERLEEQKRAEQAALIAKVLEQQQSIAPIRKVRVRIGRGSKTIARVDSPNNINFDVQENPSESADSLVNVDTAANVESPVNNSPEDNNSK